MSTINYLLMGMNVVKVYISTSAFTCTDDLTLVEGHECMDGLHLKHRVYTEYQ